MNWPKEWDVKVLDEACEFTRKPTEVSYSNYSTVPFIPMENVNIGRTFVEEFVQRSGSEVGSGNYFEEGDILFAKITPCFENGKQAIVRGLPGAFGVGSTELVPLRGRKGESDTLFLHYLLLETDLRRQIAQKMEGATGRQRVPISILKGWEIHLPPLLEQRKIAAVLFKIQKAIELQDAIIERTRDLKRSTMQHVFTHGLRGEKTKKTEIGEIPESWEVVHCEAVVENVTVGVVVQPASHYVTQGVPAFRSLNIREDRLNTDDLVFFSKEANDSYLSKSRLSAGDVVIVRTGYPGTACVVPPEYDDANCIDLVIVRPREKMLAGAFLSRFFNSDSGKKQTLSSSYGLAQQHLNVGAVKTANIPVPPLAEQKEICKIVEGIDRKHDVQTSRKSALQDLFKTMLNKLMSGELRVKDLEIEEKEVEE